MKPIKCELNPTLEELYDTDRTKYDHLVSLQKLNDLIKNYNDTSDDDQVNKLICLKQIETQVKEISENYKKKPVYNDENCGRFFVWRAHHEPSIAGEISRLMELSAPKFEEISSPLTRSWEKHTTGFFKKRSEQYKRVDPFLSNFAVARTEAVKAKYTNTDANLKLLERLRQLEQVTIEILNNGIPENKKKMPKRFRILLEQINAAISRLSERDKNIYDLNQGSEQSLEVFFNPSKEDEAIFKEIMAHLSTNQKDFIHNGYNLQYLGGSNNKNWLASNDLNGRKYVVRVEKADDPPTDYLLVENVKENKETAKFIAEDIYYYPTGPIDVLQDRPFNLAISEFCPRGDIIKYRKSLDSSNLSVIATEILDITRQLASMALTFTSGNVAYMDIKAENFLIRDDGSIITADLKSIVFLQEGNVRKDLIVTTTCNSAPEQRIRCLEWINPHQFMIYQIGLVLYDLATNQVNKGELIDQLLDDRDLENTLALDFSIPIFQTPIGMQIQQLILDMINKNNDARPTFEVVIKTCADLQNQLKTAAQAIPALAPAHVDNKTPANPVRTTPAVVDDDELSNETSVIPTAYSTKP